MQLRNSFLPENVINEDMSVRTKTFSRNLPRWSRWHDQSLNFLSTGTPCVTRELNANTRVMQLVEPIGEVCSERWSSEIVEKNYPSWDLPWKYGIDIGSTLLRNVEDTSEIISPWLVGFHGRTEKGRLQKDGLLCEGSQIASLNVRGVNGRQHFKLEPLEAFN